MTAGPRDPFAEPRKKYKICLAGEAAVGKTSLIRRFVLDDFDAGYVTTLGAKVTKHVLELPDTGGPGSIALMIWDIMGQQGIRELLRDAYFHGVQGTLMVCDVARPDTLERLVSWREAVHRTAGPVPSYLLANKADLTDQARLKPKDLEAFAEEQDWPFLMTSAKTGENVEEGFRGLTQALLTRAGKGDA